MRRTRIVIASVLKPVNDTRMYGKLARTLAATDQYEVIVIGAAAAHLPADPRIHVIKHKQFPRVSLRRLFVVFRAAILFRKLQPDIIIVCTHELLFAAAGRKIASNTPIVYDVQENYYLNIRHTKAFPPIVRNIVAAWVRWKERLVAPLIDHFLLAEKCYTTELPFVGKRTVVENKADLNSDFKRQPQAGRIRLLFTGTFDESTGVFEAIALAKQLHHLNNDVRLHLIGYALRQSTRDKIIEAVRGLTFIEVTGLHQLVDHSRIVQALATAHAGIVSYPYSPHTVNRVGTKVYEYLAAGLPFIAPKHLQLTDLHITPGAMLKIDFTKPDVHTIIDWLATVTDPPRVETATWQTEESKLLNAIASVTSPK